MTVATAYCRMFSFGEFKADDQEKVLSALNKKVEEVYRSCIGDNEANIRYVFLIHQYFLYCAAGGRRGKMISYYQ